MRAQKVLAKEGRNEALLSIISQNQWVNTVRRAPATVRLDVFDAYVTLVPQRCPRDVPLQTGG